MSIPKWLQWLLQPIISITRTTVIAPVAIRAGDDLVLSIDHLHASEDAVALLRAAQEQFPGVRLHLLVGFGAVEVLRQEDNANGCGCTDKCGQEPRHRSSDPAAPLVAPMPEPGDQRTVVILRHCTRSHLIATTIPPQVQGDSFVQTHVEPFRKNGSSVTGENA